MGTITVSLSKAEVRAKAQPIINALKAQTQGRALETVFDGEDKPHTRYVMPGDFCGSLASVLAFCEDIQHSNTRNACRSMYDGSFEPNSVYTRDLSPLLEKLAQYAGLEKYAQ